MEIKIKKEHQKELKQILKDEGAARMGLEEAQKILYNTKITLWKRLKELYPITEDDDWILDFSKKILRKKDDC